MEQTIEFAIDKKVLSTLIGLVGAISNNGKTEATDSVIRMALLSEADDDVVKKIRQEKFRISPDCATCQCPCGNTSDYPLEAFELWSGEQKTLKAQVMERILQIVGNEDPDSELPDAKLPDSKLSDIVLQAIAYLGYDLETESYRRLLEEMNRSCKAS